MQSADAEKPKNAFTLRKPSYTADIEKNQAPLSWRSARTSRIGVSPRFTSHPMEPYSLFPRFLGESRDHVTLHDGTCRKNHGACFFRVLEKDQRNKLPALEKTSHQKSHFER